MGERAYLTPPFLDSIKLTTRQRAHKVKPIRKGHEMPQDPNPLRMLRHICNTFKDEFPLGLVTGHKAEAMLREDGEHNEALAREVHGAEACELAVKLREGDARGEGDGSASGLDAWVDRVL